MSHFYGSMQGSRGEATRQGTKQSGMSAHIRGWNVGVYVTIFVDDMGRDCVIVRKTKGSNGNGRGQMIACYTADRDFPTY